MSHLVGDAPVGFVPEPSEYRDRGRRDRLGDPRTVKHGQFVAGTAAADHHDHVEDALACAAGQRADRPCDHAVGAVALHASVGHGELECEAAGRQLAAEVSPRGRIDARRHADAQRDR